MVQLLTARGTFPPPPRHAMDKPLGDHTTCNPGEFENKRKRPRDIQLTPLRLHVEHGPSLNTFHAIYPVLIFSQWDMVWTRGKIKLI